MPLGIVSDDDWLVEVNKNGSTLERTVIEKGRGEGNGNVPGELRELIAEEGLTGGKSKEIAKAFPISESSISAYKHGSVSTSSYKDDTKVGARRRIGTKVQNKLLDALNFLTDDKIQAEDGKNISSIIKDLAIVSEKMQGKIEEEKGPQVHLHLYGPKVKRLNELDIIDVEAG